MIYRNLGNTGLKVSEVGWGAEHMEGKPYDLVEASVQKAIDGGVNIIDLFLPQPEVRTNLGRAIGNRRKDLIYQGHIGAIMKDGQYQRSRDVQDCDESIKDFLTRYNTDYIDIGMMHFIDSEEDYTASFDSPYIEYVQKLRKDGIIRYIGVSTHNTAMGIKMVKTGLIDVVMFSINPAFDLAPGVDLMDMFKGIKLEKLEVDPERVEFYNLCAAKGIGITVMKAFGAGRLLDAEKSSFGSALTVAQCISFALDRPAVSSVLVGTSTVEEIDHSLVYENTTQEERDYTKILQTGLPLLSGKCMYCNHCLPCPQKIDVAAVTKYLDIAKVSSSDTIRAHYEALSAHGSDCIECGSCENNCPFKINIIENMKEAAKTFGK